MNGNSEILNMAVTDALRPAPALVRYFIKQGLGCIGCRLGQFCTLEKVQEIYGLDPSVFLREIAKSIQIDIKRRTE